jgi:hypothetical protein
MYQVTTWDGKTFALENCKDAEARQAKGEVQIFDGAEYQPGGVLKYPHEFPFAVVKPVKVKAPKVDE